ncbi:MULTISPECIES: ERF family protein [Gammaproteobacteria]|uniref:ERF family protein n=1 Tax=Gammaproteobacteria TaxID=1236 RepID=UPI002FC65831
MKHSESFGKVAAALISAKKKFVPAKKTGYNQHLKNKYSTLDDVLEAIDPGLKDNNIMVLQSMLDTSTDKSMHIETLIMHSSGEWISFQYNMPIEKTTAQGYGSTTSYGRRYALCAALGISQSDDDAEIAKRSAEDYKKMIDVCPDLDALRTIHQSAKSSLDPANWKIAEGYLLSKKAELSASSVRGFAPAKKDEQKANVETNKPSKVQSEPESIENFS